MFFFIFCSIYIFRSRVCDIFKCFDFLRWLKNYFIIFDHFTIMAYIQPKVKYKPHLWNCVLKAFLLVIVNRKSNSYKYNVFICCILFSYRAHRFVIQQLNAVCLQTKLFLQPHYLNMDSAVVSLVACEINKLKSRIYLHSTYFSSAPLTHHAGVWFNTEYGWVNKKKHDQGGITSEIWHSQALQHYNQNR